MKSLFTHRLGEVKKTNRDQNDLPNETSLDAGIQARSIVSRSQVQLFRHAGLQLRQRLDCFLANPVVGVVGHGLEAGHHFGGAGLHRRQAADAGDAHAGVLVFSGCIEQTRNSLRMFFPVAGDERLGGRVAHFWIGSIA